MMNTPSRPRPRNPFALLVTLIGILVVVLTIALAEMTVSVHQASRRSDCTIGCDKLLDASMDVLSCTQCHSFQNNGLVQAGQTMHSGQWDTWNTWYAPILTGSGILLGKLPEQLASQETDPSDFGDNTGTNHTVQPVASEANGALDHFTRLPATDRLSKTTSMRAMR